MSIVSVVLLGILLYLLRMSNEQIYRSPRFLFIFFPIGHLAVDWVGGALLLLASVMALEMNWSAGQLGLLFTVMQFGIGPSAVCAGLLGDRVRRRGIILLSAFWWVTIGYITASFAPGYWSILIVLTLATAGVSAWHPIATGIMVEQMEHRKAQALGVHAIGGGLSDVLAPLSAGFLLSYLSWQSVLQLSVLPPMLVGIFLIWWWRRIPESRERAISRSDLWTMWLAWKTRLGLVVFLMAVTYTMAYVALAAMTPLFLLREHTYSSSYTGVIFAGMLAGGALISPFFGRASDVLGRRIIVVLGLTFSGCAALVAGFANEGIVLIGALVIAGTFMVGIRPVMLASTVEVSRGRETTALGLAFGIMDGIGALGAVIAGTIGSNDLRFAIAFAGAMAFLSMGIALWLPSRSRGNRGLD